MNKIYANMNYREINSRYLSDALQDDIHEKVVCIRSLTGTGKTQLSIKAIRNYHRVLIVLSRVTLCYDFWKNLTQADFDFASYEQEHGEIDSDRLIICVNSLFRLKNSQYDLVIIDECESLIKHMQSNIKDSKRYYNFLARIIMQSKQAYLLDYGFGDLSLQLIEDCGLMNKK